MVETKFNETETTSAYGRATSVRGKAATVQLGGPKISGSITAVHTVGRDQTNAEQERTLIVLSALQKRSTILSQSWVKRIAHVIAALCCSRVLPGYVRQSSLLLIQIPPFVALVRRPRDDPRSIDVSIDSPHCVLRPDNSDRD